MYVKKTTLKRGERSYTYATLVQAYRVGVTVKHRTIANLGRIDNPNSPASFILPLVQNKPLIARGIARLYALPMSIHSIWGELTLSTIITTTVSEQVTTDVALLTKLMVMGRIINPDSKLSLTRWYHHLYLPDKLPKTIDVHSFYRSLDYLMIHKEEIEKRLFARLSEKELIDATIVFYDLTSSYFEGEDVGMARFGYSRDHRSDCLQITLGMVIDRRNSLPLYHEVFEGNMADGKTVKGILEKLKETLSLRNIIFVADKGMLTPDNLSELQSNGYQSILSESVRNAFSQKQREELFLQKDTFEKMEGMQDSLWYTKTEDKTDKEVIVCYNQYTAAKAKQTRDKKLKTLEMFIAETKEKHKGAKGGELQKVRDVILAKLVTAHARKYFDTKEQSVIANLFLLKQDIVEREEYMDGMWIVRSNTSNLTTEQLIKTYKDLKIIEASFKVIKDVIELRPIYHHKDERVKGHVFICILAYLVTRLLEQKTGQTIKILKEEHMTSVIINGNSSTEPQQIIGGNILLKQLGMGV